MKIPDAYIAKGGLGVSGPAQFPLGPAMAEGRAMVDAGQSLTFFGAILSNLNKGLDDARLKVRSDELSLQLEPYMDEVARGWRTKRETESPSGYLTDPAARANFNKTLTEAREGFISNLPKEDERITLQVRHNATLAQKSAYDSYSAEFGKSDVTILKGKLDHNLALGGGIIATMPLDKLPNGTTNLDSLTELQHAGIRKMDSDLDALLPSGLLFPQQIEQMKINQRKDITLQAINTEVQRGPEQALHVLNTINRGEPVFGIRDKATLKPIMEAAMHTYTTHTSMDNTNYTLAQRQVAQDSNKTRLTFERIVDAQPDVNIIPLITADPSLVEADRTALRTLYDKTQDHIKTGPKESDLDTLAMLGADLAQLHFGGDPSAFRNKVVANQSHLKIEHRALFMKEATDATINQRTLARAKSSAYVKDLYGSGKSFLQQISGLVMGSPETDEHKAYSVLGKITERVILNPDMTPEQVDDAFYPILREAYGTLSKPKQNIPALQSWINKMPDTGKAGAAKRSFNDILKQQIDLMEKKRTETEAAAKQFDPSKLEPKEPWEFQKIYKDLTDKMKKAWEGK